MSDEGITKYFQFFKVQVLIPLMEAQHVRKLLTLENAIFARAPSYRDKSISCRSSHRTYLYNEEEEGFPL